MLKIFRNKENMKKILWVITILIVISFGFFGTAYLLQDVGIKRNAGRIFNNTISIEQYLKEEQIVYFTNYIQYGENYEKIKDFLNIDQQTWDRLILLHEAKSRKIKISDEEVITAIQSFPFFQRDNQFDSLLYKDMLRFQLRIKPRDFEEGMRNTIKIAKLYEQVTLPIAVTENELLEEYKKAFEKVQVKFLTIASADFTNQISVSEDRIQEYYKNNQNEFLEPPSIQVDYIAFPFKEEMTEEEKDALIDQTDQIYDELLDDPDLNKAAQNHKLAVATSDFFHRDQPNLKLGWSFEVLQQAFKLDFNEMSDPIETPKGVYILKLKDKRDRYVKDLPAIRQKVEEAAKLKEAKRVAKQKAQEALSQISQKLVNLDFDQVSQELGLEVAETPEFTRGQYLPSIGISQDFQETAFSLTEENKLSDHVVEIQAGYCILFLNNRVAINVEQFEVDKSSLEQQLLVKKKNDSFNDFTAKLRIKANLKDTISKLRTDATQ